MSNQDEASRIVWNDTFHATSSLPLINWKINIGSCVDAGTPSWWSGDKCVSGLEYSGQYIEVAWTGKYSDSAFAHELMHAWQADRNINDMNHAIAMDWALVELANTALFNHGL